MNIARSLMVSAVAGLSLFAVGCSHDDHDRRRTGYYDRDWDRDVRPAGGRYDRLERDDARWHRDHDGHDSPDHEKHYDRFH